jgi:propanol-preferring alcohol dehydrogenase
MKAAVVREFGTPVVLEERPVPDPGLGQVVVKIEASGLCHTDIHAANGDWPVKPTPPFVPGHEGVGLITAVGDGVPADRLGERVAIPWLHVACGACEFCVSGWETLCTVVYDTRPLEDVNAAVDDVLHARIPARLVFDLASR